MQIENSSTDARGLDVLRHIPGVDGRHLGYPELRLHPTKVTDDGRVLAVASLGDITASKRAAGRQKDLEALPEQDRLLTHLDACVPHASPSLENRGHRAKHHVCGRALKYLQIRAFRALR